MTLLPTATKMAEYEEETVPSILLPCASCNRTFRPEALAKHTKYCEKTLIKKRKVFDSAKQRIQGTDLAEFLPVLTHKKKTEKSPIRKTQSKWKEKHMELVRAIRAARVGPSSDDPPAPMKPSDHEQCPHCDRYFGPKAYDRHLEWCKEHSSRIQPKSPASIQAKERLEARTKYRAPISIKSRRNSSRDKYQPQPGHHVRDPSPMEPMQRRMSTRTREPSPMERNRKNSFSSQPSPKQPGSSRGDSNNMDSLSRNQPHRNSKRNPSPMKKTSSGVRSKNDTSNNLSQKEVQLNDMNLNYETSHQLKNDIFSASCNITSIKPKEGMKPKMKMKMAAISAVTAAATTTTTATTTNHNSPALFLFLVPSVPSTVQACEYQSYLKRRGGRKLPVLNSINVNDDVAGMTVYACRPAIESCNRKNSLVTDANNDQSRINRYARVNLTEKNVPLKSSYNKSVTLIQSNEDYLVDNSFQNDKQADEIHTFENTVLSDIFCPLSIKHENNTCQDDIENLSEVPQSLSPEYNYQIPGDSVDVEKVDDLCNSNKYYCDLQYQKEDGNCDENGVTNTAEKICQLLNLNVKNNTVKKSNNETNCGHSFEFERKCDVTDNNTHERIVRLVDDEPNYHSIVDNCNNLAVDSGTMSCDSLNHSDKCSDTIDYKPVTEDCSPSASKRRKVHSSSHMSETTEILFTTDPLKYDTSSVCCDYDMTKESIQKRDEPANEPLLSVVEPIFCNVSVNEGYKCRVEQCSSGTTDMDEELCMDCQRSRSESDLCTLYNKSLLYCCLERKNRMFVVKQNFQSVHNDKESMCSHGSDKVMNFDNRGDKDHELHKCSNDFLCKSESDTSCKSSENRLSIHSNEWKRSRSLTFLIEDKRKIENRDTTITLEKNDLDSLENNEDDFNSNTYSYDKDNSNSPENFNSANKQITDNFPCDETNNDLNQNLYKELDCNVIKFMEPLENCNEDTSKKISLSDFDPYSSSKGDNLFQKQNTRRDYCVQNNHGKESLLHDNFNLENGKYLDNQQDLKRKLSTVVNTNDNMNISKKDNCYEEIVVLDENSCLRTEDDPVMDAITESQPEKNDYIHKNVVDDYDEGSLGDGEVAEEEEEEESSEEENICSEAKLVAYNFDEDKRPSMLNCKNNIVSCHNSDTSYQQRSSDSSDSDENCTSGSHYNRIEHFEYTSTEEYSVLYTTGVDRVRGIWINEINGDIQQMQGFKEFSNSVVHHSYLPPLKSKPQQKVLPNVEITKIFNADTNKPSKSINNYKTNKKTKLPRLTSWKKQAENFLPLISDQSSPSNKQCKQSKTPEHVVLPELVPKTESPIPYFQWKGAKIKWVVLPRVVKHVVTAILPKRFPVVSLENYDPYKSAERQMKELLGLDDDVSIEIHGLRQEPKEKQKLPVNVPRQNIISSPTSAFAKFSPIETPSSPDIPENNFIPPPVKFIDSIQNKPSQDNVKEQQGFIKDKNENPISLSSLSLCSTISIDSIDSNKNIFRKGISCSAKTQSCDKRAEVPLKRSVSAVEPHRRGRDLLKGNLKMEHLLYGFPGDNFDRFLGTPVNDINLNENSSFESLTLSNESLKKSDSIDLTSKAEQELLKSMSEFEKLFDFPSLNPTPPLIPSSSPAAAPQFESNNINNGDGKKLQTVQQSSGNKFSTDSAYNSLNRKSPQLDDSANMENTDFMQLGSSSGSESSFPSASKQNSQVARFCHECGTKYPVLGAKFCCQCGVRRLII